MSKRQATLCSQANSSPASESRGGWGIYFCKACDVTMYPVKSSQIYENKLI